MEGDQDTSSPTEIVTQFKSQFALDGLKNWFVEAENEKWLKEQERVTKVFTLSPYLYGRVYQSDEWMRHAINVELMEEDACEGVVKTLTEHALDIADLVQKAADAVCGYMMKPSLVKEWDMLLNRCRDKSLEKVVCLGKGHHLLDKCRVGIEGKEDQVVIAILYAAKQYVDQILDFIFKEKQMEDFKSLEKDDSSEKKKEAGNADFTQGNYQKAASAYTQGLHLTPFSSKLYSNRAQAYLKLEKYLAALSDGRRCIVLNPIWSKGYHRYAQALYGLDKKDQAIHVLEEGIKSCADDSFTELKKLLDKYQAEALNNNSKMMNGLTPRDRLASSDDDCPDLTDGSDADDCDTSCPEIRQIPKTKEETSENKLSKKSAKTPKSTGNDPTIKGDTNKVNGTSAHQNTNNREQQDTKAMTQKQLKEKQKAQAAQNAEREKLCLIDEMTVGLREGSRVLLKKMYRQATVQYAPALELLNKHTHQYLRMSELDLVIVKYALGKAHCETGILTHMKQGVDMLEGILVKHRTIHFPLVFLTVGQVCYRQNRFNQALERFEKGLHACEKPLPYGLLKWPCSDIVIEETREGQLKVSFKLEINRCRFPPSPDGICRYAVCSGHTGDQDGGHFHVNIYITDPDFKGYVRVICYEHCHLEFHIDCWKRMRSDGVHSDKDMLQTACLTPNCHSYIKQIDIYDQTGSRSKSWKGPDKLTIHNNRKPPSRKLKLPPSSKKTIKQRQDKKMLRKQRKAEARQREAAAVMKQARVQGSAAEAVEASYTDTPSRQEEPTTRPNTDPILVLKKSEASSDGDTRATKTKGSKSRRAARKKDKVLSLDQFVAEPEGSPSPGLTPMAYSPPPVASSMGMDDFSDFFPSKSSTQKYPEQIPVNAELAARVELFEATRNVKTTKTAPPKNPWVKSAPTLEIGQHESIRETVVGLFIEVLQNHGPLAADSQLVLEELDAFPPEAQALVHSQGGIVPFLCQFGDFVQVKHLVCLRKDLKRATLMTENEQCIGPAPSSVLFSSSTLDFPPPSFETKNSFVPLRTLSKESLSSQGSGGSSDRVGGKVGLGNNYPTGQRSMSISSVASDASVRSSISDKTNKTSGLDGFFGIDYGPKAPSREASPALSSSSGPSNNRPPWIPTPIESLQSPARTPQHPTTPANDLSALSETFKKLSGLNDTASTSPSSNVYSSPLKTGLLGDRIVTRGDLSVTSEKLKSLIAPVGQQLGDGDKLISDNHKLLTPQFFSRVSPVLSSEAFTFKPADDNSYNIGTDSQPIVSDVKKETWSTAEPEKTVGSEANSLTWQRNMEWSSLVKATQDMAQEVDLTDFQSTPRSFEERLEPQTMIDEVSDDDDLKQADPLGDKDTLFPSCHESIEPWMGDLINDTCSSSQSSFSKAPGAQRSVTTPVERPASVSTPYLAPPGFPTAFSANDNASLQNSSRAVSPMSLGSGLLGPNPIWSPASLNNTGTSSVLPSKLLQTDYDFMKDTTEDVYNALKDQEGFKDDPSLRAQIIRDIQKDMDRSNQARPTSGATTVGTQTSPVVSTASVQTDVYEPHRQQLDETIALCSNLKGQYSELAARHNHSLQVHSAQMNSAQQSLQQVALQGKSMESSHANTVKELEQEKEKLGAQIQHIHKQLTGVKLENQALLAKTKSDDGELESLRNELLQMTLKHESVRFESEGIQEELDAMKTEKLAESSRARAAEMELVKLKLEVGIQILDNSLKHCEHQVATCSVQNNRVKDSFEPEEVKIQYKEVLEQWQRMVEKICGMKAEAQEKFGTQLKLLQEGRPLKTLPTLDIPTPPPPPATNLPSMPATNKRTMMPTPQSTPTLAYSASRPSPPPGLASMIRPSASASALDKPNDLLAFAKAAKKSGLGPAPTTWSNGKTAAEIVAAGKAIDPKPTTTSQVKLPVGLNLKPQAPVNAKLPVGLNLKPQSSSGANAHARLPVGLNLPAKAGRQSGKSQAKNSYGKIVEAVTKVYPIIDKSVIDTAIRSFREQRGGSLSGLSLHEIVERVLELVSSQQNTMSSKTGPVWGVGPTLPPTNGHGRREETDELYEEECTICYDGLNTMEVTRLGCNHAFHSECLRTWLSVQSTCPHCRKLALMPDEFPSLK